MGKQHDTFPNEQPEMPVPSHNPEINQPYDPKEPQVPNEEPGNFPQELPEINNPAEKPGVV